MKKLDLRLSGIRKEFPGVQALRDVDFDLRGGEVHGLIGQNGAGKSTLIKILTGALAPDAGEVVVDGEPVHFAVPADAEGVGITVVHQDMQLFTEMSIADNVLITDLPVRRLGFARLRDRRGTYRRAKEVLHKIGVDLDVALPAGRVGPAEKKFVEVARAVATDVRALLLDEPTAALQPREAKMLLELIDRLRAQDRAVLFVSHKLDEVLEVSDRITVLRDGAVVACENTAHLSLEDVVELVAGGAVSGVEEAVTEPGEVLLSARALGAAGVDPVHLDLRTGEVVSLTGLPGSGATALARAIAGAARRTNGEVLMDGHRLRAGSREDATLAGIGFLPEDRRSEGIVPELSIEHNIALASIDSLPRWLWLSRWYIRTEAQYYIRLLDIDPPDPTMAAGKLSGGNQQKVLLARWLASNARVLIAEEPTHGIDVRSKPEIQTLLRKFVLDDGCVVLVSTELAEVLGLSDRIGVFRKGRLIEFLPRGSSEEEVTARAVGLGFDGGASG